MLVFYQENASILSRKHGRTWTGKMLVFERETMLGFEHENMLGFENENMLGFEHDKILGF